jgi:glycosyltransferase involved in cell wall biosynthesis
VFVNSLPAEELQRRLDVAARRRPEAQSLTDFRASSSYCSAEVDALRRARRLFTPHAEVGRHLKASFLQTHVEILDWVLPRAGTGRRGRTPEKKPVVAFAASSLARKGALEMAEAVRQLGWRLLILGTPSDDAALWQGIEVAHVPYQSPAWLASADVVALPAFIEHGPRALLTAIVHGVPVVATPECGLGPSYGVIEVEAGDVAALKSALLRALDSAQKLN